jgi:hypothetical protein
MKYHARRIKNRGNLKQAAWCCRIEDAISISQGEINACLRTCIERCEHFQKHRQSYRRKHLQHCLTAAKEKDNKETEKQILAIIQQEKDRTFWRCIHYVLGKQSSGVCFKVQVLQEDGGGWLSTHPSRRIFTMRFGPILTRKGSTLQKKHPCAPATCKGNLVTMKTPKLPGSFWQATMSTLQTLTRQQERSLRSVPRFGS